MKVNSAEIKAYCRRPYSVLQLFADVGVKRHVDVFEKSVAHEVGPRKQKLFGRRAEDFERARQLVFVHSLFHGEGRADHHRRVDVVAFGVSGSALDERLMLRHSGRLGISRRGVVFGVNRDYRMTGAVGRHERSGHA